MGRTVLVVFALLGAIGAVPADERDAARLNGEANRLFEDGQVEEALSVYGAALAANPDLPALRFNMANALFRLGRLEEAEAEYAAAAEAAGQDADGPPDLSSDARFNQGNARFQAEDFKGAAELYRDVLLDSADDTDARHNMEMALARLQEQQQQQQDGDQDQDQKQEQDQDQDPDQQQDQQQPSGEADESDEKPEGQPEQSPPSEQPSSDEEVEEQPQPVEEEEEIGEEEARRLLEALSQDERRDLKDSMDRRVKKKRKAARDW